MSYGKYYKELYCNLWENSTCAVLEKDKERWTSAAWLGR